MKGKEEKGRMLMMEGDGKRGKGRVMEGRRGKGDWIIEKEGRWEQGETVMMNSDGEGAERRDGRAKWMMERRMKETGGVG